MCLFFKSFIPESPRWLIAKNRHEEAFAIIENIAKTNNKGKFNRSSWEGFLETEAVNIDFFIII